MLTTRMAGGQIMNRFITILSICAVMAGCASAPMGDGATSGLFDYAPSGSARTAGAGFGYELNGGEDWSGLLNFQSVGGVAKVDFSYASLRSDDAEGELDIAMPYMENGVRRYEGVASDGREVAVRLQAGPCEQAGERFTHFAAVRVGSIAVTGCALERNTQERWSSYLMEYLPAIDMCLEEMGDAIQYVSLAYAMPGGSSGVRMVDGEGQTWECALRDEDQAINSLRQLDAADAIFGEGDPVFVRGDIPELGAGCFVYESVRHADGTLIGAFGHDACDTTDIAAAPGGLTRS